MSGINSSTNSISAQELLASPLDEYLRPGTTNLFSGPDASFFKQTPDTTNTQDSGANTAGANTKSLLVNIPTKADLLDKSFGTTFNTEIQSSLAKANVVQPVSGALTQTTPQLLDAVAAGANIGDFNAAEIERIASEFSKSAAATGNNTSGSKKNSSAVNASDTNSVSTTTNTKSNNDLEDRIQAAKDSAEVMGTNGKSDVQAPLYDDKTKRNADGGVDTAWWVNLGLDKFKVFFSTGFGDTNKKNSSPPGSINIFAPDGTTTSTVSANTMLGPAQKAWDVLGDPEKLNKVLEGLSKPGFSFSKWVDKPSITFGAYNDSIHGTLATGTSYTSVGATIGTPVGKVVGVVSIGNGGGTGATFADLKGKYPIAGSISVALDPMRGLARLAMTNPFTALPGAALGVAGELGFQNRVGISVPFSFGNVGNPNFEGFRDPNGNVVTDPANAIKDTVKGSAEKQPLDKLLNYGDKRVAGFNNELQLALGNDVFKIAAQTRNSANGQLENNGSHAVGLANQFSNVLQSYGGLSKNENISSTADFNQRVNQTINRLGDQGREKEIDRFLQKLANPYSVNGGNSYVADANKAYAGAKVDPGTASEVRDIFGGKYKPTQAKN